MLLYAVFIVRRGHTHIDKHFGTLFKVSLVSTNSLPIGVARDSALENTPKIQIPRKPVAT